MSISYLAMRRALRTRTLSLEVCTTGSTTLAATTTGYTRAAGSFVGDGFHRGMELTASGFTSAANNGTALITRVQATALTVSAYDVAISTTTGKLTRTARPLSTETAAAGRTVSVGLPAMRAWEGLDFEPDPDAPWVGEQLVGGPSVRPGIIAGGRVEVRPMYALHIHLVDNLGAEAADAYADALMEHFPPSQAMTLAGGELLRVRDDTGPFRGQLIRRRPGFLTLPFTIPLWLYESQPTT